MNEKEYILEMLCCTPKELLLLRMNNSKQIPEWLETIDKDYVEEALRVYDNEKYSVQRLEMIDSI